MNLLNLNQLEFISLTINIICGHGPSNNTCDQLQPKKTEIKLCVCVC